MSKRGGQLMNVGTRLPISLAKKLSKLHNRHYASNRGWAIKNGFANSIPFDFDYAAYNKDSYADMWRMNIELHDAMNNHWNETVGDDAAQDAFGLWVIQSWGGSRAYQLSVPLRLSKRSFLWTCIDSTP